MRVCGRRKEDAGKRFQNSRPCTGCQGHRKFALKGSGAVRSKSRRSRSSAYALVLPIVPSIGLVMHLVFTV